MAASALRLLAVVGLLAVAAAAGSDIIDHGSNWNPELTDIPDWFAEGNVPLTGLESVPEFRAKFIERILDWSTTALVQEAAHDFEAVKRTLNYNFKDEDTPEDLARMLHDAIASDELTALETDAEGNYQTVSATSYPYFGFIPMLLTNLMANNKFSWSTPCWGSNTAEAAPQADGSWLITVTNANQKQFLCGDSYAFFSTGGAKLGFKLDKAGTHTLTWNTTSYTAADWYDLKTRGVRMFKFNAEGLTLIGQVIDTALLFTPMLSKGVSAAAAARNMKFLSEYAHVSMTDRKITEVTLDPSEIKSGDFFGIIRLDGLDPMLGWAMGSTTGHTTTALWDDGALYVAESTAKDSYWPTNGIQRTPFDQWVSQAKAAGFNVVHVPLNADARAKYNVTAAIEFFERTEGLNYGYHNMFWGWIDTVADNYPCTPPDFNSTCLTWDLLEPAFGFLNKAAPSLANLFYQQAFNFRLGTEGKTTAEIYQMADEKKIPLNTIATIVEEDSWKYNTTRYGKPAVGESMVCCVFVCHMWKAAGVFGDDTVNCGELTNFDDYVLDIFETTPPPSQCLAADPTNPVCQILGAQTLYLNSYNSKAPYSHMAEHCPSEAPLYKRPANC